MSVAYPYPQQRHYGPQSSHLAPSAAFYSHWFMPSQPVAGPSTLQQMPLQPYPFTFVSPYHLPVHSRRRPTWAPVPQPSLAHWANPVEEQYRFRPCLSPLPIGELPEFGFPPSPTDTCSSLSSALTPPPPTEAGLDPARVVCAVPLLAPRPLPYHSPRFLQFEDLPDPSEDLSHPPYTQRPKRKRADADDDDAINDAAAQAGNGTSTSSSSTSTTTSSDGAPPAKRAALAPVSLNRSRHRRVAPPPPSAPRRTDGGTYAHLMRG